MGAVDSGVILIGESVQYEWLDGWGGESFKRGFLGGAARLLLRVGETVVVEGG